MTKKELTKMMIQEYEDHKPAAIGIVVIGYQCVRYFEMDGVYMY